MSSAIKKDKSTILTASHVKKSFKDGNKNNIEILKDVDLSCLAGQSIGIMGASGCGKSTLLHCLAGLEHITGGSIELIGEELSELNETQRCQLRTTSVGFIYQFHHLLPEFNALENVMMPLWLQQLKPSAIKKQAMDLLDRVGLKKHAYQNVQSLSGGERQRVAIARAMVSIPRIIFADEPTGNLDEKSADSVMALLLELNNHFNTALILVTHNKSITKGLHKNYELQDGKLKNLV